MRGLWIQLPVPDFNFYYLDSNIPLAAGYIILNNQNFLIKYGLDIEILPQEITSLASDHYLINYILSGGFDFLFFTTYMWNIERSLYIVEKIKEKREIKVVFGGPEISFDSPWIERKDVDVFFVGEGEGYFKNIFLENFPHVVSGKPFDVSSEFKNPYSEGILKRGMGKNFFLETMRGCPYRCKYCFYSKNRVKVRFYHEDLIKEFFRFQIKFYRDSEELYILDPSFEVHPEIENFLGKISKFNSLGLPIHTEIRAEKITSEIAKLMKDAGFKSVELGLQSTSKKVLNEINRKTDLNSFLKGVENLKECDIEPQIGIIIGLPGDTLNSFYETALWLKRNGLSQNSEAFILSLLPQTELREGARHKNIGFMDRPPYFVLRSDTLDERGIFSCIKIIEDVFNIEYYPWEVPNLLENNGGSFIGKIEITSPITFYEKRERIAPFISNVLTIEVKRLRENERKFFLDGLVYLLKENPYLLFNIVFCENSLFEEKFLKEVLNSLYKEEHYYNRLNYYREDYTGIFSVRLHLKGDLSFFKKNKKLLPYFSSLIYEAKDDVKTLKRIGEEMFLFENFSILYLCRKYDLDELKEIKKLTPHFFDTVLFKDLKTLNSWDFLFGHETAKYLKLLKSVKF